MAQGSRILITLLLAFSYVTAQTERDNTISFELFGDCIFGSINYERKIVQIGYNQGISLRTGVGYNQISIDNSPEFKNSVIAIPLSTRYLVGYKNIFELGFGISVLKEIGLGNSLTVLSTNSIGYRHLFDNERIIFRIAFTPIYKKDFFLPFIGFGWGYLF